MQTTIRTKFRIGSGQKLVSNANDGKIILVDHREKNIKASKVYDCTLTPMHKGSGYIAKNIFPAKDQIEVVTNENSVTIKINSIIEESVSYFPKVDGSSFNKFRDVLKSLFVFSASDVSTIKKEFEKLEKQYLKVLKRKCK